MSTDTATKRSAAPAANGPDATDESLIPETETNQAELNNAVARWPAVACGAAAAIGVAWAAAYVTMKGVDKEVGIAAWVAAAVVGASATIAAANGPLPGRPLLAAKSRLLGRLSRRGKQRNANE